VAAYAYLSGQDYVVAYVGRAGQTHLRAEQRVVSYGAAVAYVHQVVYFCSAANAGLAYAGSVDAGVGLQFGIALYYHVSGLDDLVPAAGCVLILDIVLQFAFFNLGEAETVAAYYYSVLQQDVVAQAAEFSYYGVGVGEEIVAYGYSAIDDCVGQQDGVVSDYYIFVDYYIGAYVRVLAQLRFGIDHRSGMDSGGVARWLVEKFDGFGPGQIGILAAQHSGGDSWKIFGYDDRRGFGDLRRRVVPGIGNEGQLAVDGLLYAGYSCDFGVGGGVFETGVEGLGDVG
jgi:hypothetical protein